MKLLQFVLIAACGIIVSSQRTIGGVKVTDDATVQYQTLAGKKMKDKAGNEYDMGSLAAQLDIFSSEAYDLVGNDKVKDKQTGDEFDISVYEGQYIDGTTILATLDEKREVAEASIMNNQGTTRLIKVANGQYATFDAEDTDLSGTGFVSGDGLTPDGDRRNLRRREPEDQLHLSLPQDQSERNLNLCSHSKGNRADNSVKDCGGCYKRIRVGIVMDKAFVDSFPNGETAARRAVQNIVAAASWRYQQDMCVKLVLAGIRYDNGPFDANVRGNACDNANGKKDLLRAFSSRMNSNGRLGFLSGTAIHFFSGVQPTSATIGCAWIGTVCNDGWSYGVDYVRWGGTTDTSLQAVLLAHELGHNLNAQHQADSNYIMFGSINKSSAGFSSSSINRMIGFLNGATCDWDSSSSSTLGATLGGP